MPTKDLVAWMILSQGRHLAKIVWSMVGFLNTSTAMAHVIDFQFSIFSPPSQLVICFGLQLSKVAEG